MSVRELNNIINNLSKTSIDIFKKFYEEIKCLRKRKRVVIKEIGEINYDLRDLFNLIINNCSDNTNLTKALDISSHFNDTYPSTIQYWLSKIYSSKTFYDTYYSIYNYASSMDMLKKSKAFFQ
jgi:hypothetical protein